MAHSDPKTGSNNPISYTMIVSGCLKPFLAFLDFFDSYHVLAMPCKLKELGNLPFLTILDNFCVNWHFLDFDFLVKKSL